MKMTIFLWYPADRFDWNLKFFKMCFQTIVKQSLIFRKISENGNFPLFPLLQNFFSCRPKSCFVLFHNLISYETGPYEAVRTAWNLNNESQIRANISLFEAAFKYVFRRRRTYSEVNFVERLHFIPISNEAPRRNLSPIYTTHNFRFGTNEISTDEF